MGAEAEASRRSLDGSARDLHLPDLSLLRVVSHVERADDVLIRTRELVDRPDPYQHTAAGADCFGQLGVLVRAEAVPGVWLGHGLELDALDVVVPRVRP